MHRFSKFFHHFEFWLCFQFLGLFITVFHRPYLLDIYNRLLVSRQINAKHQYWKRFRENGAWKTSCPGIVCPGIVLSGKRLSGKVTVRETSDNPDKQRVEAWRTPRRVRRGVRHGLYTGLATQRRRNWQKPATITFLATY